MAIDLDLHFGDGFRLVGAPCYADLDKGKQNFKMKGIKRTM
jgi:hypothetical protein